MKASIFLKPLEYNIEILGEKWQQGALVKGVVKVKNNGSEKTSISNLKIALCSGSYKKLKTKDAKTFEVIAESIFGKDTHFKNMEEKEFPWEFKLDENARITDKDGSLYIILKDQSDASVWPIGILELTIIPKIIITQFLEIFENFIRFKIAQIKYVKEMIEVKMTPPKTRELAHVESLILRIKEVENTLSLDYQFNVSAIDMTTPTITTQKKCKQFARIHPAKEYLIYGDSINQELLISSINAVVSEVKNKLL